MWPSNVGALSKVTFAQLHCMSLPACVVRSTGLRVHDLILSVPLGPILSIS